MDAVCITADQHTVVWNLAARPQVIRRRRDTASAAVVELGAGEPVVQVVRLGVSELLTNVARHVEDPNCRLEISKVGPVLYVQVSDRSFEFPRIARVAPGWDTEGGRGLWLLRSQVSALGCTRTAVGKNVWFRCDRAARW
ncbi:ATP-binding protein [Streptomyces harbinensis]|uniref:ATP-binding protein n=1 Tax=Streptomyces harbinensis TaxID=1176198 RepID=UPI0036B9558B